MFQDRADPVFLPIASSISWVVLVHVVLHCKHHVGEKVLAPSTKGTFSPAVPPGLPLGSVDHCDSDTYYLLYHYLYPGEVDCFCTFNPLWLDNAALGTPRCSHSSRCGKRGVPAISEESESIVLAYQRSSYLGVLAFDDPTLLNIGLQTGHPLIGSARCI